MALSRHLHSREKEITFAESTRLQFVDVEIVRNGELGEEKSIVRQGQLLDEDLESWLSKDPSELSNDGKTSSSTAPAESRVGVLRILYGNCSLGEDKDRRYLPFTKQGFDLLEKRLYLPWQYLSSVKRYPACAFTTYLPVPALQVDSATTLDTSFQPETCLIMKCSNYQPSYYHVGISWCPKTSTTYCLLVAKIDSSHQTSLLIEAILGSKRLITSPLCVAVHLVDTCVRATQSRLVDVDGALNELEEVTGQHEWTNRPLGDPMAMDFLKVGRKLNFNSRTLAIEKMRAQTLVATIQELKRIHDAANTEVSQLLRYHENACNMQICSIDYQDRRVQSQLAVVYQFMSQKDSKTNIELAASSASIAKETKRDGTAMKTIAILTMFFLPGTFLAALFAMPLFNWEEPGPVISPKFKYYWAIAIPLTFSVMLFWACIIFLPWSRWSSSWRVRREDVEHNRKNE